MKKIAFIVPGLSDSHFRNRVLEFIKRGYSVDVYGFTRIEQKDVKDLPYKYKNLGVLHNEGYKARVSLYLRKFRELGQSYKGKNVVFYLCGLDIAIFFHYLNPSFQYIYEECDLVHTYLGGLKRPLEWIDKRIIRKSLMTVTTSEGFINYHFKGHKPENVALIENRLNPSILEYEVKEKKSFNKNKIEIGFVGAPRFDSVFNLIDVFCKHFPNGIFHVFGGPIIQQFESLRKYQNCVFHGFFKNPIDLPDIYSKIDVVVATYDTKFENVRYAEPNKIYEAIYFETPIVVSTGTFLAEKVNRLGIGYDVDALNDKNVVEFINSLTAESLLEKKNNARKINKREALNVNDAFFEKLEEALAE